MRAVEEFEPKLIVLDTISRFIEGKEDSADTWQNLYIHSLIPLRRQGRTVLRLDHQGHDSSKGARGSSGKRDDVDVAWIMKRTGNNIVLTRDKSRGLSHPEKLVLRRYAEPTKHGVVADKGNKVAECLDVMAALGIPFGCSRDVAAGTLRDNKFAFSNETISHAVRVWNSSEFRGAA
ncbi:hypothetical protein ACXDF8_24945 [Mycolicibacterium sp. CBM1]